MKFTIEQRA